MLNRIRVALVWVLLFALPFQGFAAASLLGCGANHHRMSVLDTSDRASPASAHEHHRDAAGDHPHADKVAKCSACAACCVGAALPAAPLLFAAAAPADAPAALRAVGAVGFLTDGPERPPRTQPV